MPKRNVNFALAGIDLNVIFGGCLKLATIHTRHMGMKPFPTLLCDLERLTLYSQPQLSHMKDEGFGFTKL